MTRLYAQGDILFERLDDTTVFGRLIHAQERDAVIIAEGELTGHHHKLLGTVAFFRDDGLARDIPDDLYVGHVQVKGAPARLEHEEHATLELAEGTYRVRRQRCLEPSEVGLLGD
jgi:hypothetical protein